MLVQVYETDAMAPTTGFYPNINFSRQLKVFCKITKLPDLMDCFKCPYFNSFDPDKMEVDCKAPQP